MAVLSVLDIILGVMFSHLPIGIMTRVWGGGGLQGGALLAFRLITGQRREEFVNKIR